MSGLTGPVPDARVSKVRIANWTWSCSTGVEVDGEARVVLPTTTAYPTPIVGGTHSGKIVEATVRASVMVALRAVLAVAAALLLTAGVVALAADPHHWQIAAWCGVLAVGLGWIAAECHRQIKLTRGEIARQEALTAELVRRLHG